MPFKAPFQHTIGTDDLFYGLARQRDSLMKAKGVFDQRGHKINDYFIGSTENPKNEQELPLNAEFKSWLKTHPKYGKAVDLQKPYTWPYWRIKSKGGIEWATTVKKINVHFCLDKMLPLDIMQAIVEKTWDHDGEFRKINGENLKIDANGGYTIKVNWEDKIRSITNAELRWIYRNKNNADVQRYVQFWSGNIPCTPPWDHSDELKELWETYKNI